MAESKIDVDLLNPGQVFACLGLIEAAEILLGEVEAIFDWNNDEPAATFRIAAAGGEKPTERVMGFLEDAKVVTLMPVHSDHATKWKKTWGDKPMEAPADTPFPYPDPRISGPAAGGAPRRRGCRNSRRPLGRRHYGRRHQSH